MIPEILYFTANKFENQDIDFLNIKIMNNSGNNIYIEHRNIGLHINCDSYKLWLRKTAWIKALYYRAHKIYIVVNLFSKQAVHVKRVLNWNGYPCHVGDKILKHLKKQKLSHSNFQNRYVKVRYRQDI